jgi:hypothetical protein
MTSTRSNHRELVRLEQDIDQLIKQVIEAETEKAPTSLPPCRARVVRCLESAVLWADELPRYANIQQSKADFWAIAAGIVASITGLAIFPVLNDSSTTTEKAIVTLFAFTAAVFALVPRIRNYAEEAGEARTIATAYGPLVGRLLDARAAIDAEQSDPEAVRAVIDDFEAAKAKKDQLRYLRSDRRLRTARADARERMEKLTA